MIYFAWVELYGVAVRAMQPLFELDIVVCNESDDGREYCGIGDFRPLIS